MTEKLGVNEKEPAFGQKTPITTTFFILIRTFFLHLWFPTANVAAQKSNQSNIIPRMFKYNAKCLLTTGMQYRLSRRNDVCNCLYKILDRQPSAFSDLSPVSIPELTARVDG